MKLAPGEAGEVEVTWKKFNKDINIDGYYIQWRVKGRRNYQREILQNPLSVRYTISGLQNSTKYSVRVRVFKKTVEGPWSKITHQRTSSEPVSFKMAVTLNDSESVTVTWKRLWKKNSGEDTLESYTVSISLLLKTCQDKLPLRTKPCGLELSLLVHL